MHRLNHLVVRVWHLTRTIMSLTSTPEDSTSTSAAGPAHEIAKAYRLLSAAQNEDNENEVDTRKILSACWRATKEASSVATRLSYSRSS
jgi:predicted alpha-1,6-mannanase (GH76 family)